MELFCDQSLPILAKRLHFIFWLGPKLFWILCQIHLGTIVCTCGSEAFARRCSVRKAFLKISKISQEITCAGVSFLKQLQALAWNFIKKVTLAQVFSSKFCKTFKNTYFTEHFWWLLLPTATNKHIEIGPKGSLCRTAIKSCIAETQ